MYVYTAFGFADSERKIQKQTVDSYVVILRQLKENCTCPICQESYSASGRKKPKLLPECCHSACEECVGRLCGDAGPTSPCCPLCRTPVKVPRGGAARLPDNVDAVRSLDVIAQVRRLSCRRHPGSTEDLCCLSCVVPLCARCYVDDHAQHDVTTVQLAAEVLRPRLEGHVAATAALDGHLARAEVALNAVAERAAEVQRRVLEEERTRTRRVEGDAAVLLEQLAARLDPAKSKVVDGRRSLDEVVRRCRTIVADPRELVRHFVAVRAELERLSHLTEDIDVDEIERQRVDFTPLPLTDWIPDDSVNLVGRLTPSSSDDGSDPPTQSTLRAQLDTARLRESALLMELQAVKEQQTVVSNRLSEQAIQYRQREAALAARHDQLCRYIQLLKAELVKLRQSERDLTSRVECELVKNGELERTIAAQEEHLAAASSRMSELESRAEELQGQIGAGELRRQDLEERLKTETKWRRNAEAQSRERRYQNEDLVSLLEEERSNAARMYGDLQDRATTLLKDAKKQARQSAFSTSMNENGDYSTHGENS